MQYNSLLNEDWIIHEHDYCRENLYHDKDIVKEHKIRKAKKKTKKNTDGALFRPLLSTNYK